MCDVVVLFFSYSFYFYMVWETRLLCSSGFYWLPLSSYETRPVLVNSSTAADSLWCFCSLHHVSVWQPLEFWCAAPASYCIILAPAMVALPCIIHFLSAAIIPLDWHLLTLAPLVLCTPPCNAACVASCRRQSAPLPQLHQCRLLVAAGSFLACAVFFGVAPLCSSAASFLVLLILVCSELLFFLGCLMLAACFDGGIEDYTSNRRENQGWAHPCSDYHYFSY